ncbi:MAG: hypothetical protein ACLP4V_08455 [Methylocella sp.]
MVDEVKRPVKGEEIVLSPADVILSDERLGKIRRRAKAAALEARLKVLEDQEYERVLAEEQANLDPDEGTADIVIDVPLICIIDTITLDAGINFAGRKYVMVNGQPTKYTVPKRVVPDLLHIMYRARLNEVNSGSPNRDMNVRKRVDATGKYTPVQVVSV